MKQEKYPGFKKPGVFLVCPLFLTPPGKIIQLAQDMPDMKLGCR